MAVNKGNKPIEVREEIHKAVKVRATVLGITMRDYIEGLIKKDFKANGIDIRAFKKDV